MLLIGSKAAAFYFDFRKGKDTDILGTPEEVADWVSRYQGEITRYRLKDDHKLFVKTPTGNIEIELVKPGSSSEAFIELNQDWKLGEVYIAKPTTLYLLKKSHVHHPIHWRKNIEDYHFFKSQNLQPTKEEWAAYELRRAEIDARQKKRKVNLNMTNEDFFKKSSSKVPRMYEHDDLHRVTCYYGTPLYDTLKRDKSKAKIDSYLWDALPYDDKLRTVREECYAIALERKIIPGMMTPNYVPDTQEAFMYALQRVCTTLTTGWFREFAIEKYPEIKCVDRDYFGCFLDAIAHDKLKVKNE